jgi:GNAT superfamily N-acetyltransferase
MIVRRGEAGDADAIARLHIASWQATYRDELPAEFLDAQDLGARTAHWEREMGGGVEVLVADERSEVVGFVACGPTRDEGATGTTFEVYNLHAAPGRHGTGVGGALFDAASSLARDAGATQLSLWVVETNANARAFYERRGMQADGARQVHPLGPGAELREVRYRVALADRPR